MTAPKTKAGGIEADIFDGLPPIKKPTDLTDAELREATSKAERDSSNPSLSRTRRQRARSKAEALRAEFLRRAALAKHGGAS